MLQPPLVTADAITGTFDVVIVGVKAFALQEAMADMRPAIGPETMLLPVLNGMRHIDLLSERFGAHAVLGGAILLATTLKPEGQIVQLADIQQIRYGELDGTRTSRIEALDAALQDIGFDTELSSDIVQGMWEKWVQLASLGTITCLANASIGAVAAVPGGIEFAHAIVHESASIAAACGHPLPEALLERYRAAFTMAGSPLASSMYRDLRDQAPVEVEAILDDLLERGRARGVRTPLLEAAAIRLRVHQQSLLA